jgi:transposase InsO family protein
MHESQVVLSKLDDDDIVRLKNMLKQNNKIINNQPKVVVKNLNPQEISQLQMKLKNETLGQQLAQNINDNNNKRRRLDTLLSSIYFNPSHPAAYSSVHKVFMAAKKRNKDVEKEDVEKWLSSKPTYSQFKQTTTKIKRRKIIVRGIKHQFQADLMDLLPFQRSNLGYKYLLTIVDCFSRKADAIPLKTKQGKEVKVAFQKIFNGHMGKPKKIQTDQGSEFYNSWVKSLFKEKKIIHFHTKQNVKAAMVERFNRTLRNKINKHMDATNSFNFINALPKLIQGYNNAIHSSLKKYSPNQVNKKNEKQVREILYGDYFKEKLKAPKFQIGDQVLVTKRRKQFDKNRPRFGKVKYVITEIIHEMNPPMYRIQHLENKTDYGRPMYTEELHKISTV